MRIVRFVAPSIVGLAVFVLLLLLSSVAYAAGEPAVAEPNALTRVAEMVFDVLVPVLAILAAELSRRLLKVFSDKTGVELSEKHRAWVDGWVDDGMHLLEERSYKKVKEQTGKLRGSEKLEGAADFVLDLIDQYGLAGWTREKVISLIEARVGTKRANGGKPSLDKERPSTPKPLPKAA